MFDKPAKTVSEGNITEIILIKKIRRNLEKRYKNDFRSNISSIKRLFA